MKHFDKKTKTEFLQIVKNYYNGNSEVKATNFGEVADFAKMHQLLPMLLYMLINSNNYTYYNESELKSIYFNSIRQNLVFTREGEMLKKELTAKQIPFYFMKGQFVKNFYTPNEVRSMGDIDTVISESDLPLVEEILASKGYKKTSYYDYVTTYSKNNIEFELHTKVNWFNVDWAKTINGDITFNDQVRLTIIHAIKHIVVFGCGIRQLLDIAFLLKEDSSVLKDSSFIKDIDSINVTTCFYALIGVINKWFSTSYFTKATEEQISVLETAILDGGVFGKNVNDYNSINTVQNKSKLNMYFRMLFPKYERMCKSYPILTNKKYLLLYYYFYRLFTRGLKEKRYKLVSLSDNEIEAVKNREQFVKSLEIENQYYNKI